MTPLSRLAVVPWTTVSLIVATAGWAAPAPDVPLLNARDHGARGDGVADDTAALQAAFDAATDGRTIYLPPGTYLVTATLRLPSNAAIVGAGAETTILRANAPLTRLLHGDGVTHLRLADLTLQGGGQEPGGETNGGLVFTAPAQTGEWPLDVAVERVRIAGFRGSGLVALGASQAVGVGLTVRDCTIRDLGRHAVLAYFCQRILVEHCYLERLGGSGTIFPRVADVTVRDCSVRETGLQEWGHGLEVGDESCGFLIENNLVENSGDHAGILIEQGAWRGVIVHNRILRPRFQGIQLNNKHGQAAVKEVRVVGNLVDMGGNRDHAAMLVYGDTTFLVEDCLIESNTLLGGKAGLEMHDARRGIIARNLVRDAAGAGLELIHHQQMILADNHVQGCGREGLWVRPYAAVFTNADLTVTGNTLLDNSRAEPGAAAGIRLEEVHGARLLGNRVGGGHRVGLEAQTCDGLVVVGNDLRGNTVTLDIGPDATVGQNLE